MLSRKAAKTSREASIAVDLFWRTGFLGLWDEINCCAQHFGERNTERF
jgi:hypothetical protein